MDKKLLRPLGKTGFELFPVVYGGIVSMLDGQEASDRSVAWAIERGINYFDVAPQYGDAQEKLGNSLKPHRDKVYLACKTLCRSRAEAEKDFAESLRLLHTDHFDVYQMHALSSQEDIDAAFARDGVLSMMLEAQAKGYVRKLGITCHTEKIALQALERHPFDTMLFPLNWQLNLRNGFGSALCAEAKKRGVGILAMKSLIHRCWRSAEEKKQTRFKKSWCKPIDDEFLGVAAFKYAFHMGADVLVPPGNFESFSFAVENIEKILATPLDTADLALLRKEFANVHDEPFLGDNGEMISR